VILGGREKALRLVKKMNEVIAWRLQMAEAEGEVFVKEEPDINVTDEQDQHASEGDEQSAVPISQHAYIKIKLGKSADDGLVIMVRSDDGAQDMVRKSSLDRLQEEGAVDHIIEELEHGDKTFVAPGQGRGSSPVIKQESEDSEESNQANVTPANYV
jgi:hypothetical protein